jgi:hypothetical protein
MTAVFVRRALHHGYAATALALVATGWLIGTPEARGLLLGGFGRELLDAHLVLGVVLLALPLAALGLAGRPLLSDLRRRLGPPDPPWVWRKVSLASTLVLGLLLIVSGFLLWLASGLPVGTYDAVLEVHVVCTWILALLVPVHIVAARRRIAARWAELRGSAPPVVLHEDAEGDVIVDAEDAS